MSGYVKEQATGCDNNPLKYALSWVLWPALFVGCMAVTAYGFSIDQPIIYFNLAYIFLIISQVCLGVVAAEFGLYWVHRAGHETAAVWRFHAVHHSVTLASF